jgi:hypothetical protein
MTDRPARIRRILSVMMPVEAMPNIHGYLWSKQIYCVQRCAQAVTDETMADGTDAQARAALDGLADRARGRVKVRPARGATWPCAGAPPRWTTCSAGSSRRRGRAASTAD